MAAPDADTTPDAALTHDSLGEEGCRDWQTRFCDCTVIFLASRWAAVNYGRTHMTLVKQSNRRAKPTRWAGNACYDGILTGS